MVNNFLSEKCLQEKFRPKWAECFIHVLNAILLVELGFNKFLFSRIQSPEKNSTDQLPDDG
jgi:hypothetical protein